jgi:hypothetical protein
MDLSSYVLASALPQAPSRVAGILDTMRHGADHRFGLAELNDVLAALPPGRFREAVSNVDVHGLTPFLQNYVAAMVEQTAHARREPPPLWVRDVRPLEEPYFAAPFPALRPYLLRMAPVTFKRRNIFVDATVGDRV